MYTVFVPDWDYGVRHPVAWFTERLRALDYSEHLATTGVGEFSKVIYHPEDYMTGSGYVGEIVQ